jgi:P4 family phage/plasmid primase-like protien
MMGSHPDHSSVLPDPASIRAFVKFLFDGCLGWAAVREFAEKGQPSNPPRTPFFPIDDDLPARVVDEAGPASDQALGLYVIPGSVSGQGKAKAADVTAMTNILVDLDRGDVHSYREHLVKHLGEPSLEVASGGATEIGQQRLHLYWRLKDLAAGDGVTAVCRVRSTIAAKVFGDPSFASPHQPIRVAGSVYRKNGVERLVTILAERPVAYDLRAMLTQAIAMPSLVPVTSAIAHPEKQSATKLLAKQVHEGGIDGITRFEALSSIIGYWIRRQADGHVTEADAEAEILSYNEACIVPPWPLARLRQEISRIRGLDAKRRDRELDHDLGDFSEDSLALGFTRGNDQEWKYVAPWRQWLVWNGVRWERENTLKVYDLARATCREAAAKCNDLRLRRKLVSASTIAAVERLARADRQHAATTFVWDRDPWVLNTPDGVVNLRDGLLRAHIPADLNTKIAAASPSGTCANWQRFLARVTNSDLELQAYLQRVLGYCLTGVTSEHALFFLYGTGANGKSVFINTVAAILGDYATVAPMDMFMAATGERHPTDMAGLRGARLVTATETEQGRRWAESKLKTLTGGDKITARFMRGDFFEFVPQFKLVIAGNHKPEIRNIDEAMRRRLHLIPFTVTIPTEERDQKLPEKLLAERDGILAWIVEGCRNWQQFGLKPPRAVAAATEEYFAAEDSLGRWLEEACEQAGHLREFSGVLFAAWKSWAEANGEFVGSIKRFSEKLAARGFDPFRQSNARGFRGLALRQLQST